MHIQITLMIQVEISRVIIDIQAQVNIFYLLSVYNVIKFTFKITLSVNTHIII